METQNMVKEETKQDIEDFVEKQENAIEKIREAQQMLNDAIEIIEQTNRAMFEGPNSQVEHYLIPYLKIRAGNSDYCTNDYNLDKWIAEIEESIEEAKNDMQNMEE